MENPTKITIPKNSYRKETDLAYCFEIEGQSVWIPKSQIRDYEENSDEISFWCPKWLIVNKDLQEFVDTSYMPSLF